MAKKIQGYIKLMIPAGTANPSPPLGPALGQRGVNIMEFTKAFNARTESIERGVSTPTIITVFGDKSFSFVTKTAPASYYLKKAAGLKSGSNNRSNSKSAPNRDIIPQGRASKNSFSAGAYFFKSNSVVAAAKLPENTIKTT